ncbi:MAG: hypothetical protein WA775_09325 [Psychroserpens sp.]|uniref:hypothetical protein n=1 Tax=Psychroserpens sp. TaxID=2020870 RepID=UPI003CA731F1
MNLIKQILSITLTLILLLSFTNCSTAQKLQKEAPVQFGEVYCENWSAGVQGGGSGLNIFITVKEETNIILDSVYFRGKSAKLQLNITSDNYDYIGNFKTDINQSKDIILSSDRNEEYINNMPKHITEMPFELKDNECVVSYFKGTEVFYYKISKVIQREPLHYPSSPRN